MHSQTFQTGLERLVRRPWLKRSRARIALLAHPASLHRDGVHADQLLRHAAGRRLVALFGPEHGYFGGGAAGEPVAGEMHPSLGVRVHSLYGARRMPGPDMLKGIDVVVVDLQDLGVRCYTYGATLRLMLEACAREGIRVIVADRPLPGPGLVDGPPQAAGSPRSFVNLLPAPLVYGLTPGETALWLRSALGLNVEVDVEPCTGWCPAAGWPADRSWIPPSPGIRSVAAAMAYPATVWTEALPALDCDRGGLFPFQVLGAPDVPAAAVLEELRTVKAPAGVAFHSHRYRAAGRRLEGVRLTVTAPARFRPAATGYALLWAFQRAMGPSRFWRGVREDFLDQLAGGPELRYALRRGDSPARMRTAWRAGDAAFGRERRPFLLYDRGELNGRTRTA